MNAGNASKNKRQVLNTHPDKRRRTCSAFIQRCPPQIAAHTDLSKHVKDFFYLMRPDQVRAVLKEARRAAGGVGTL